MLAVLAKYSFVETIRQTSAHMHVYARMSLGWKAQQQQIATLGACWIVSPYSRVAQWKRAGPITQRSVDRNHALLTTFSYETFYFGSICILLLYLLPTIKHRYSLFAEHRVLFLRVHAARVVTTLPICISIRHSSFNQGCLACSPTQYTVSEICVQF